MIFERGYFNSTKIEKGIINESFSETKSFSFRNKAQYKPTVFLCHKHSDLNELQGVMGKLEEMGAKVYIDSMDNSMPDQTSGDTAQRIKEVIKYCKKFILLATDKAIESVWCNWELGIGDTYKFIDNIAILPIKEVGASDADYKGSEYLQIYPRINYNKGFTNIHGQFFEEGFYYEKPKDKNGKIYITELSFWLKQ